MLGLRCFVCIKLFVFQRNALKERSTSFTDLAAALSKVPAVRPALRHSLSAYDQADDVFDDADFFDRKFSFFQTAGPTLLLYILLLLYFLHSPALKLVTLEC